MKKTLLFGFSLLFSYAIFAQSLVPLYNVKATMTLEQKRAYSGDETRKEKTVATTPIAVQGNGAMRGVTIDTVGATTYDLQTNNAVCRRIVNLGGGKVIVGWTRSNTSNLAASDRGTGYNYFDGTNWQSAPTARIENQRTGWPNLMVTRSGRECVVAHTVDDGLNMAYRNTVGTGTWQNTILAGDTGATWARATNVGDSLYVITGRLGSSFPSFLGLDGGVALHRSWDGGDTWIGPDSIQGLNTNNFTRAGGDAYAIDAKDNVIVIVIGMVSPTLFKSTDYGDTWTMKRLLPNLNNHLYSGQVGETFDSTVTTDESYSVLIDHSNVIHVWYGRNVMLDDDAGTAGWTFYPYNHGIMYWNSNMSGEPVLINETRIPNDTLVFADDCQFSISSNQDSRLAYSNHIVSMPSTGIDAAGNIYLSYSGIRDGSLNTNGSMMRALYLLKSMDGGNSWIGPHRINTTDDEEAVYGSVAKLVDDSVHIVYQSDNIPGTAVQELTGAPVHPFGQNQIVYTAVGVSEIVPTADITCPTIGAPDDTVSSPQWCPFDPAILDTTIQTDDIPEGNVNYNLQFIGNVDSSTQGYYNIQVYALDSSGNSSDTIDRVVEVIADTEAPVIMMNGYPMFSIMRGDTYVDAGAYVTDNGTCDLDGSLSTVNSVDTGVVGAYTVTYDVTDMAGNAAVQAIRYVSVVDTDTVAPVITITGDDTTIIEVYNRYIDAGATAFDNIDLDITGNVVSNGTVDTARVGFYPITYDVSDAASNAAMTATRIVAVVDLTPPVITLIGDSFVYETINTGFDFVDSATAMDNYDGDVTADVVTDTSGLDMTSVGVDTVVYRVTDSSGNTSEKIRIVEVLDAPVANFSHDANDNGGIVSFEDLSTNSPTSWEWDFDDGGGSFQQDPVHNYTANGTYDVCLTVRNPLQMSDIYCEEINVNTVGIAPTVASSSISVRPNPSEGIIYVDLSSDMNLEGLSINVVDILGRSVYNETNANINSKSSYKLDLSNLTYGVYIVKIENDVQSFTHKITLTESK